MSVNYWIAQYVDDVFRREPRNVGVFVEFNGEVGARFFGVGDNGQIDGRRIRNRVEYPDVYRQWVDFWRAEVHRNSLSEVLAAGGSHYHVVSGGAVDDVEAGELYDVVNYLYAMLVSEGGMREALGVADEDQTVAALVVEVVDSLKEANLLASNDDTTVLHPVRRHATLTGSINIEHRPEFVQENGRLYVMETVDFTTSKKKQASYHAGWSAYMFNDIKSARPNAEPIAIVRFTDADAGEDEVRNGLALLRNEGRVVNWLEEFDRLAFLAERRDVANSE